MATHDEVEQALLDAIKAQADLAAKQGSAATAANHGQACASLAEAVAWLVSPNQPHGASSVTGG